MSAGPVRGVAAQVVGLEVWFLRFVVGGGVARLPAGRRAGAPNAQGFSFYRVGMWICGSRGNDPSAGSPTERKY